MNDAAASRLESLAVLAVAITPLAAVQWLNPAGRGMSALGTHTQAGLPPCGFEASTGLPCATCGVTTSFTLASQGDVLGSLATQPFGFALSVYLAMIVVAAGWSLYAGISPRGWLRVMASTRVMLAVLAVMLLSWMVRLAWVWFEIA